jgi:hypothetical protein
MKKVSGPQVVTPSGAVESPLPPRIQEALGELVGAAKEGLLALSVGVGLGVVHELMEAEVDEVVGPKGKWKGRSQRQAPWSRAGVDDARRAAGAGQPTADTHGG